MDFFQCDIHNNALVDPSRHLGNTLEGVLTIPTYRHSGLGGESRIPHKVLDVRITSSMVYYKSEKPVKLLDHLLPIYALLVPGHRRGSPGNTTTVANHGALLFGISQAVEILVRRNEMIDPDTCGTVTYLRKDGKPLLKHHYEALKAFVFTEEMKTFYKTYRGMKQELEQRFSKDRFRAFWASYCERNGLEKTPCPLDM